VWSAASERYSTLGGGTYLETSALGHHRVEGPWLPGVWGCWALGMQRPRLARGAVDHPSGLGQGGCTGGGGFRGTPEAGDMDVGVWEGEGGALGPASGRESSAAAASEGDASWLVGDTDWKGLEAGIQRAEAREGGAGRFSLRRPRLAA